MEFVNQKKLLNNPILVICPTRERIKKCKTMLNSFLDKNNGYCDIIFGIDEDDPNLEEYKTLFSDDIPYVIQPQMYTTQIFNKIFELLPHYRMYHQTNDDFVYETSGFDEIILSYSADCKTGIYYGNDLFHGEALGTAPFITGDIVRALGWLQMPRIHYICNDLVYKEIGEALDIYHYINEVVIKHNHPLKEPAFKDHIFDRTNDRESVIKDRMYYALWHIEDSKNDILKVKELLEVNKPCISQKDGL